VFTALRTSAMPHQAADWQMGGVSTGPAHQHSDQDRGRPRQGRTRRL